MPSPEQRPPVPGQGGEEPTRGESEGASPAPTPGRPPAGDAGAEVSPTHPDGAGELLASRNPSVLSLIRISRRGAFPPGGADVYNHVARMLELGEEHEFLLVPCGRGTTTQYLVEQTHAAGAGVDPDPALVDWAETRAKQAGLTTRIQYERGQPEDLPYKDGVFDVAIGELGVSAAADPAAAVRELVRVTKPMGTIVLIQLIWTGSLESERRRVLIEHLGARPYMLVEWKRMLRDAGAVDLHVEDWSDTASSFRQPAALRALGRVFSLRDKLALLFRAWQRWGWRGIPQTIRRQNEVRRLILQERVLGLSVIRATKWDGGPGPDGAPGAGDTAKQPGDRPPPSLLPE